MPYEIEFFRWSNPPPDGTEIIRRHSGGFASLDAAKLFGLANTGTRDSSEEADGFVVTENGVSVSMTIIKLRKPAA